VEEMYNRHGGVIDLYEALYYLGYKQEAKRISETYFKDLRGKMGDRSMALSSKQLMVGL